ncbi:hypothetical protein [Hyphomonas sp.]|uniref:hypothetical protein n=1 Tax=Hyphomonas sp. TaxID=87 RepID=UPI00391ACDF0
MTSPKTAAALEKLTAIKRQKAEQEMLTLQAELRRMEDSLAALGADLSGLDTPGAGADMTALAYQQGRLTRLIAEIRQKQAALPGQQAAADAAREALKRALYSEDQIARLLGASRP